MITNSSALQLCTGTTFVATDKLLRTYRYRFDGLDLTDLSDGVGCRYIVLYNLDTSTETCVEAQWFSERKISDVCTSQKITPSQHPKEHKK